MPVKQGSVLSFLKRVFIDVDYPDETSLNDSQLQESLERVDGIEMEYIASTTSTQGGEGNSIVEKVEVDTAEAARVAEEKAATNEQKEQSEKTH